jgi:cyclopropane-fatty-acyl-phospholipid synthase
MDKVSSLLSDDGLFLLHTIGRNDFGDGIDPWINKHVFPGAVLPSMNQITMSVKDLFVVEDWHNFGYDYYPTLLSWWRNFQTNYSHLDQKKYPHMFYRTQDYYLRTCAGSFSSRYNQLWQVVLSKKGVSGGYPSIR